MVNMTCSQNLHGETSIIRRISNALLQFDKIINEKYVIKYLEVV